MISLADDHGAKVNAQDEDRRTPFDYARTDLDTNIDIAARKGLKVGAEGSSLVVEVSRHISPIPPIPFALVIRFPVRGIR